ncbi:hypothetical protein V6N13_110571 [Hibiscus sabdariffa]
MESDGINNGLISYQLSIEGSSFEALLDTEDDSVFNEKMESDGNNNVFNSNQLGYSDLNPLKRKKEKGRRIDRIAGSGTWKVKGPSDNEGKGHWIMHEFSLINNDQKRPLEVDEDDSEDDMLRTVPPLASIEGQHNVDFQLSKEGSSFGELLDTQGDSLLDLSTEGSSFDSLLDTEDDSVFDAMMGSDGINNVFISNQLGYLDLNPLKRYLSSLYCIEFKNETTWPCNSKRFQGNSNDGGILEIPLQQQQ